MDTSLGNLQNYAYNAAIGAGIDPNVFLWQMNQESSMNPNAVNGNAVGIAQIMPGTAQMLGLTDRTDPFASLNAAAQYDASLLNGTCGGDYMCMLNHYGTTANVSQSVINSAQGVIGGIGSLTLGLSSGGSTVTSSDNCGTWDFGCKFSAWFANWSTRLVSVVLGLIFIAGAIYLYKSN